jgi:group II intron reverse transcriptase/maturase
MNHDILMERLRRHVNDGKVLGLVRSYLNAGIMVQGVVTERYEGTPQGGPLSPLLANVLLDEVDRELERSGHRFVRYADDCNVYVRSQRAGERVLARLRRCYARLRLRVNEAKSAIALATRRPFLGFALWSWRGEVRRAVSSKALARYKERVRRLTRRTRGRSIEQVAQDLGDYVPGWTGYFHLAQTPRVFCELDEWMRHRLRVLHLKQWRRGNTMYRELRALGAKDWQARNVAANSRCWWRNSAKSLNGVLTLAYFDRLGVPRLS